MINRILMHYGQIAKRVHKAPPLLSETQLELPRQ